jgi:hypothetical protein
LKTKFLNSEDLILETIEDMNMADGPANMKLFRRWAYDVGRLLITDEQLERRITIIPVDSYRVKLPDNFQFIDEIAAKVGCKNTSLKAVATQYKMDMEDGCELELNLKCHGCPKPDCDCDASEYIIEVDRTLGLSRPAYSSSPLSKAQGSGGLLHDYGYNKTPQHDNFILMSPSTDYKEMYQHHLPDCINLQLKSDLVYYIQNGIIETNFKEGEILLIYFSLPVDENSNILIPDTTEAIEAFQEYMIFKYYKREYLKSSRPDDQNKYKQAEADFDRKMRIAKAKLQIPAFQEIAKMWKNTRLNKLNSAYSNYLKKGIAKSSLTKYPTHRSR